MVSLLALSLLCATTLAEPAVPDAVRTLLEARWPGHSLGEVERLGEAWEIDLTSAEGVAYEVLVSAGGAVLHVHDEADEQAIPVEQLPEVVTTALAAGWPGATVLEAERAGTAYELELRTAEGTRMELVLGADGTLLASGGADEADDDVEDD